MNEGAGIPENIRRFVLENINSVEQLEVLLLLQRTPERGWSADEVTAELRSSTSSVRKRLDDLHARRLVQTDLANGFLFRYQPATPEVGALVAGLAQIYHQRRFSIIGLIYGQRRDPVQELAEAFRIKKEDDDG